MNGYTISHIKYAGIIVIIWKIHWDNSNYMENIGILQLGIRFLQQEYTKTDVYIPAKFKLLKQKYMVNTRKYIKIRAK